MVVLSESYVEEVVQEPVSDPAYELVQALARKVYAIIKTTMRANIMTGEVNQSMLPLVPTLIGLSQEQCDQFIEAFISSGMLERRGGKL